MRSQGVRILDFSRVLAGPFATMMLGDLGAEVHQGRAAGQRATTRAPGGRRSTTRGEATYFQSVNRNKRSVVLDLATARRLAPRA